jgi:hypothetical protein
VVIAPPNPPRKGGLLKRKMIETEILKYKIKVSPLANGGDLEGAYE